MKKLFAILFILCIATCGFTKDAVKVYKDPEGEPRTFSSFPIPWGFSCSYPEKLKPLARRAFKWWDDMTPVDLFREVDGCGIVDYNNGIYVIHSDSMYDKIEGETVWGTAHAAIRLGKLHGGVITLWRPWLQSKELDLQESVIRHEIGHLLGFDHGGDERCLMYPYITDKYRLQGLCKPEKDTFRRLYGRVHLAQ